MTTKKQILNLGVIKMRSNKLIISFSVFVILVLCLGIPSIQNEPNEDYPPIPTHPKFDKFELSFPGSLNYVDNKNRTWIDPFDYERNSTWIELSYCFAGRLHLCAPYTNPGSNSPIRFYGYFDGDVNADNTINYNWKYKLNFHHAGLWKYEIKNSMGDPNLTNIVGYVQITEPTNPSTKLKEHGYPIRFRKTPESKQIPHDGYLTYADGTPFKWLADSWLVFPQGFEEPYLTNILNKRKEQGFTTIRSHGWNRFFKINGKRINALQTIQNISPETFVYWDSFEEKLNKVNDAGFLVTLGFGNYSHFDKRECYTESGGVLQPGHRLYREGCFEDGLKRLFMYALARFGAQPVTFLITQEFNYMSGNNTVENLPLRRNTLVNQIGTLLEDNDPYNRAKTLHFGTPDATKIVHQNNQVEYYNPAENWGWVDFYLLQSGHRIRPQNFRSSRYSRLYSAEENIKPFTKPFMDMELNYEAFALGFQRNRGNLKCIENPKRRKLEWRFDEDNLWAPAHCQRPDLDPTDNFEWTTDADTVAETLIDSVQFGAKGFSYGASGLFNAVRAKGPENYFNGTFEKSSWGPLKTMNEALHFRGPDQLARVSAAYDMLSWWKLNPIEINVLEESLLAPLPRSRAPATNFTPPANSNIQVFGYTGAKEAYRIALPNGIPYSTAPNVTVRQQIIVDIHEARYQVDVFELQQPNNVKKKIASYELNSSKTECNDGRDNDLDGVVDSEDINSCGDEFDDSENSTGIVSAPRITLPAGVNQPFRDRRNIIIEAVRLDATVSGYQGEEEGYVVHYPSGGRQNNISSNGSLVRLPLKVEKNSTEYEVKCISPRSDDLWSNVSSLTSTARGELLLPRPSAQNKKNFLILVKRK